MKARASLLAGELRLPGLVDQTFIQNDIDSNSTCVANAGAAHTLSHWRIHLKSHVLHWLEHCGHLTNDKILERESWNIRKREKYANALVDMMEGTGAIRTFYNELKGNQKAARANLVSCLLLGIFGR